MKTLLSKKRLSNELLMELKTSLFIHPSTRAGENSYYFSYVEYGEGEVLYLFTSHEEFLKCYSDEFEPVFWYLDAFEDDFYKDTLGIIINPGSDSFFIPSSVMMHIIADIKKNNANFTETSSDDCYENINIHKYFEGKKTLKMYRNLFECFDLSTLFTVIESQEDLGECEINLEGVDYSFCKENSYYLIYTDINLLNKDFKNKEGYFYYMIADAVEITKKVLEFDFEGIILKTPVGEFTLPRKNLLRHYESVVKRYKKRKNAHETAYCLGDGDV